MKRIAEGATTRPRDGLEHLRPDLEDLPRPAVFVPHRPERPEKSEAGIPLKIVSEFEPRGDQRTAIPELVEGIQAGERDQVLLGATGTGKTFTMAKIIEATQRPALILAPNKTLAAQLYGEFKSFFPDNAVEYFVSYYDYYQPEAYVPRSDLYIEKESSINEADRPDAPLGHPRAAGARRRDHRRLGVVHLRHRLGRDLLLDDVQAGRRPAHRPARCWQSASWRTSTSATTSTSPAARSASRAT
jgi:hypothetical protein